MDNAKRIISGTWGEVWLDGEYVSECYGCKLAVKVNKEKVQLAGKMAVDNKVTNIELTGSLKLHKCSSRMARLIGEKIKSGQDVRFTIISKLADPDAYGAERVCVTGVSFDDLTLADWEVGKNGSVEAPFTYTDYSFLDLIPEV
ncbi:phage portal protein [Caproiciproducens galactitolivorans]|uniref:Phage-like element PBSX protein XkdM n=1 Tax=Caproiciproducens galactitolivorans TaxID=642589 RepID=A0A4Z0Y8Z0_9FIRM|nr:phage tail tube protein [Caproiciproducens galactitolivorans]QEY34616.1 phage portal protein [Caproiciproducens galactitolivorans]TGJ75420.1 phage-like element PBSX protein XkdM [Caproiciproducens galactitolivorans]